MGGKGITAGDGASLLRLGLGLERAGQRAEDLEDRAEALEVEAVSAAARAREQGREEARQVERRNRAAKARRMTRLGGSGLALSGSPLLAAAADAAQDEEEAAQALDSGQAESILLGGRARARSLRRSADAALLTLGSSLWDRTPY